MTRPISLAPNFARPTSLKLLFGLELFDAVGGFVGGVPLLADLSGKTLGVTTSMLAGLPVNDYFVVGLWLFFVYGIGSLLVAYMLWTNHSLAIPLAILESGVWFFWVLFETVIWGPNSYVLPWLVPPLLIFLLLSFPSVRGYLVHGTIPQVEVR